MLEQITKILRDYKGDNDIVVTIESTFEELGLDSLDTVQLTMTIEEKLSVTIPLDENIKSIGDIIEAIEKNAE